MTSPFERRQAWDQERNLTTAIAEKTRVAQALLNLVTANQVHLPADRPVQVKQAEEAGMKELESIGGIPEWSQ